jgi:CBS domain-containing protein
MMIPLRVDEVMSTSVETTTPRATVEEAADRMRTAEVGSLIVVEDEDAVGIVTRTDLVDAIADALDVTSVTVADVMSGPLMTVEADAPVEEAAEAFRRHEVKHLAVVEDGALAGVVTVTDLSYYLPRLSMLRSDSDRDDADYAALGTNETASRTRTSARSRRPAATPTACTSTKSSPLRRDSAAGSSMGRSSRD